MNRSKYLLLCSILLSSCVINNTKSTTINTKSTSYETIHDYSEISDKKINWNEMFSVNYKQYFVYFYSLGCHHCNELKNDIIEFALNGQEHIYFIQESIDFVISDNIDNTIGISSIENMAILGFPSLVYINNSRVMENIGGISKIRNRLKI